jgi:hypothetical protein
VNKRAVASVLSRLPGFRTLAPYYIGSCNREVIAGYALDAPPGGLYISRFVLPAYDRISFLHLSLGKRIAQFPRSEDASSVADLYHQLISDWDGFSKTRDCKSLAAYLDREQVEGDYCQWARYLTYVKSGDFESALRLESRLSSSHSQRAPLVAQNFQMALETKTQSGWGGLQELLAKWSELTVAKFCK